MSISFKVNKKIKNESNSRRKFYVLFVRWQRKKKVEDQEEEGNGRITKQVRFYYYYYYFERKTNLDIFLIRPKNVAFFLKPVDIMDEIFKNLRNLNFKRIRGYPNLCRVVERSKNEISMHESRFGDAPN